MDLRKIMTRAWELYRKTYGTSRIKGIGRQCFQWALREAWAEARLADAAPEVVEKAARVAHLNRELSLLTYREDYRAARRIEADIRAELSRLAA